MANPPLEAFDVRVLGLDHGSKRIGIALSDELRTIAQPVGFLPAKPMSEFMASVRRIIAEKQVNLVVVGMPRNMDGTYGPSAEKVRRFVDVLRKEISLPIETVDERLTSAQASRALIDAGVSRLDRKERTDATAAALLLQSYLDSQPGRS